MALQLKMEIEAAEFLTGPYIDQLLAEATTRLSEKGWPLDRLLNVQKASEETQFSRGPETVKAENDMHVIYDLFTIEITTILQSLIKTPLTKRQVSVFAIICGLLVIDAP